MQCSGMGVGIQVFGASAFMSGMCLGFFGIEAWHIHAFGHWSVWALGCLGLGVGVGL